MAYTLSFKGAESVERFELTFAGFLMTRHQEAGTTRSVRESEARILEAFQLVSVEGKERLRSGDMRRVLQEDGGTVTLSATDFERLRHYVDMGPWTPGLAPRVRALEEWFAHIATNGNGAV